MAGRSGPPPQRLVPDRPLGGSSGPRSSLRGVTEPSPFPFELDFDSSEATVELQQITLPPGRPRPPKRTARGDARRLLGRLSLLTRRRVALLREDIPLWQRQRRALAVLLLLVLLVASITRGGDGAAVSKRSSQAVQPQPAGDVKGAEVTQIQLAPGAILKPGAGGPDVRTLQEALRSLRLTAAKPDGLYGKKTKKAVKKFQRQAGLTPDGIAGPRTIAALNRALANLR